MSLTLQAHQIERFLDPFVGFSLGDIAHLQAEADVLAHRHVRKQRIVLEHHAETAILRLQRVDALVIDEYAAARRGEQAGDAIERGGFAAAGGAEQSDELALADGKRHVLQRIVRTEGAAHAVKTDFLEWR
eukprot:gene20280-biopygen16633